MLKTITILLFEATEGEPDEFNHRAVEHVTAEEVSGVLVGEPSTEDVTNSLNLYGKRVAYTLAIPKGDAHSWVNALVVLPEPFEGEYRTIGYPTAGIEANIPLKWNKKVNIERIGELDEEG